MGILYNFIEEPPKSYTMPTFCPTCMEAEDLYKLLSISKGVALPALCPTKIEYAYPEAHGSLNFRKDEFLVMSQIVMVSESTMRWRLKPNVLPFDNSLHEWHYISPISLFDAYYSPSDSMCDGYVYNMTRKRWYEPCFKMEDLIE